MQHLKYRRRRAAMVPNDSGTSGWLGTIAVLDTPGKITSNW
jgi:hypothetical protein